MDSAKLKLAAVGMPLGREARRISRLVVSLVIKQVLGRGRVGEFASGKCSAAARWLSFERLDERFKLRSKGFIVSRHRRKLAVDTERFINGQTRSRTASLGSRFGGKRGFHKRNGCLNVRFDFTVSII